MSSGHEVRGRGEPLLVLNGYGVRSSALEPVVAPLAEHFECLTFDYPLAGGPLPLTPLPLTPLTVPAMAAAAVAVLDRAGHRSAHVLGISLGGMVAQEMAIRFPDRVRGLVLAATTAGGPRAVLPDPRAFLAGLVAVRRSFADASLGGRALAAQGLAATLHDTSRRLRLVRAPTLVVHGEQDLLVPVANARLLHEGIRGSVLEVVPGAGHLYFLEEADDAAARVVGWLRRTQPAAVAAPGAARRSVERVSRTLAVPVGCARAGYGQAVRTASWLAGAVQPGSS